MESSQVSGGANEDCQSSESGWTMYLGSPQNDYETQQISTDYCGENNNGDTSDDDDDSSGGKRNDNDKDNKDDNDDDDSMASDASSGLKNYRLERRRFNGESSTFDNCDKANEDEEYGDDEKEKEGNKCFEFDKKGKKKKKKRQKQRAESRKEK